MAVVTVSNVTKQFGSQTVFDGASLQVHAGETVGLIGPNGAGKTTLFRLIAGEAPPDTGTISVARNTRIAYLRQEQPVLHERTVYDEAAEAFTALHALERRIHALAEQIAAAPDESEMRRCMSAYERAEAEFNAAGGHMVRTRIQEVLSGLGFAEADFVRPVQTLSGGERCRVALARLLLEDASLLLLDEPTNHLDIDAVGWLEKYLSGYAGGVLLVSHDRFLLDRVCDATVELEGRRLTRYSGNYSTYAETKAVRELTAQRQFEQDRAFIAKEQAYIAKHLAGQRSNQAKGRRTRLERRLDAGEFVTSAPSTRRRAGIAFAKTQHDSQVVLRCDELSVAMEGRLLIGGLNMQVFGGERLGITGPNGTGKTTLLRTLVGELPPHAGRFELARGLRVGYHAQAEAAAVPLAGGPGPPARPARGGPPSSAEAVQWAAPPPLDPARTVVEEIRAVRADFSEPQARSYAARFLFLGDDVFKPVEVLSGGEKSRLRLAGLILAQPDLLVLDEPTNHLDIPSREALEEALSEFNGTVIAVSHDRYFLDRVASRLLVIRQSGWHLHTGTYSDYAAAVATSPPAGGVGSDRRAARPKRPQAGRKPPSAQPSRGPKEQAEDAPGKPDTSQYNHLSIADLEALVIEREVRLAELQQRFGQPELYQDPDARAELEDLVDALSDELTALDAAWQERVEEQG